MAQVEYCLKTEHSDAILDSLRGLQPSTAEMTMLHRAVTLDKEASRLLNICPSTLQKQMLDVVVNRIRRVSSSIYVETTRRNIPSGGMLPCI